MSASARADLEARGGGMPRPSVLRAHQVGTGTYLARVRAGFFFFCTPESDIFRGRGVARVRVTAGASRRRGQSASTRLRLRPDAGMGMGMGMAMAMGMAPLKRCDDVCDAGKAWGIRGHRKFGARCIPSFVPFSSGRTDFTGRLGFALSRSAFRGTVAILCFHRDRTWEE